MLRTELPPSVLYTPKNLGPGTRSMGSEGLRIEEENSLRLKRHDEMGTRVFHLRNLHGEGPVTSVVFEPSKELDIIGLYPQDSQRIQFVARNGIYIEVGSTNSNGTMSAKYDLTTGSPLSFELNPEAFPYASFPLDAMRPDDIEFITNLCSTLRNPTTPNPTDIAHLKGFVDASMQISEPSTQLYLFEH